jgi:hypothetical protein
MNGRCGEEEEGGRKERKEKEEKEIDMAIYREVGMSIHAYNICTNRFCVHHYTA